VPPARSLGDGATPPPGGIDRILANARARRVRNVAIWSIAFFVASVPVALVSGIGTDGAGEATVGTALAVVCWLIGFATCIWSFALAFRHWDALPLGTRWLASLPLVVVLFLLALSMVVTAIRAA
jgi:hypothetical protein